MLRSDGADTNFRAPTLSSLCVNVPDGENDIQ